MKTMPATAEFELLTLAVQAPFDRGKLGRAEELLRTSLDWTVLVETAVANSVTPLLCRTLEMLAASAVPEDVLLASRTHLDANRSHNAKLTVELLRILKALDHASIPAIPFKGPMIAERYYEDPSLRSFHDLDFLVPKSLAAETTFVLQTLGYAEQETNELQGSAPVPSQRQVAATWNYAGEYLFFHHETGVAVEPHWAFAPTTLAVDLDYPSIWSRAQPGTLAGQPVLDLSPSDTLLSLTIHGGKEYWRRLQWVSDLHRVLANEDHIDWIQLLDEARRLGALRILLVGLQLSRLLLGTNLDPHVMDVIERDSTSQMLALKRSRDLCDNNNGFVSHWVLSRDWFRMLERPGDRARYVFRTLTTPRSPHFEMLRIPDRFFAVYYAIKLVHDYFLLPLWLIAKRAGIR